MDHFFGTQKKRKKKKIKPILTFWHLSLNILLSGLIVHLQSISYRLCVSQINILHSVQSLFEIEWRQSVKLFE